MHTIIKAVLISAMFAATVAHAANPGAGASSASDVSP